MLRNPRQAFSVPRSLCGAAQFTALSGSFGHLCASRNAQVPLRYTSQPFRRKSAPSRSLKAAWFCLSYRFFSNFNHAVLPSLFVGARSCNAPCLPVNKLSPKIDRAACMWTSRQSHCSLPFRQRVKPKKRPRNGHVSKPTKNDSIFCCRLFVGAKQF